MLITGQTQIEHISWTDRCEWRTTSDTLELTDPVIQGYTKERELLKNPTKIEEIHGKKIIDRNW